MSDTTDIQKLKEDLWKKMAQSPFVMFGLRNGAHSVPLTAQLDEDLVDTIYFLIGRDNRIAAGGPAMLQYVSKGHDYFACISGTAKLEENPALVDKFWNKWAEAWFPQGKEDPNLGLLRFDIDSAELWDSDVSVTGVLKLLFGGTLRKDESGNHARVSSTA